MNKDNIVQEHHETFDRFTEAIALFDDESFNKIPFEGSWTPAQVVEHVILSDGGFADVVNAAVKPSEKAFDGLISQLKSIFLNFETKLNSPDFILPQLKDYDREKQITTVKKIDKELEKAIAALDLTQTCVSFELPGLGFLTRYEAIYFVIYHTQRHTHQLREIHRFLKLS